MLLGYHTNGFAHHAPEDALRLLAEMGYGSVALTLDHGLLNPYAPDFTRRLTEMRRLLDDLGLRSVVETGARFLLDPRVKHEPTLVSPEPAARARRVDFLLRAVDAARELGSDCVSLWSGVLPDGVGFEEGLVRLTAGLLLVLNYADDCGVTLGFEPEPGMLIDSMARYEELLTWIHAPHLRLTLDIGHLHCQGETPLADYIRHWGPRLVNVHIEDMRRGVHEHLQFGEGEVNFPPVITALRDTGYQGGLHVELSRHSHMAPLAAQRAYDFLSGLMCK